MTRRQIGGSTTVFEGLNATSIFGPRRDRNYGDRVESRRVLIVAASALVAVAGAVLVGGLPLAVSLAIALALVAAALPGRARRHLGRRSAWIGLQILTTMALVWILVHNYRDDSRLDDPGIVPAIERYIDWIAGLVSGEMGQSSYAESVGEGISRSLPISLQLVLYSQIIAIGLAVPGALLSVRLRGRLPDAVVRALGLAGLSLPVFILGPLLMQLFGLHWKLLPVVRYSPMGDGIRDHFASMALPSLTLALSTVAIYLVLLRAELIGQLALPHALLARSKGIPPRRIVSAHALRPASPSTIAAIAAQSGAVLGNVVIVERIFLFPGFGDYTLVAIGRRDVLAVAGALFVAALVLAAVNLIAEALLLVVDPRISD